MNWPGQFTGGASANIITRHVALSPSVCFGVHEVTAAIGEGGMGQVCLVHATFLLNFFDGVRRQMAPSK